ncbi:MAG TPA: hypothetical protein VNY29_03955 [Terriglobales bacterium]|jgi:hypothetical protein|nr:hypothetical protein [Terriglobales bacterium]
MAQDQLTEILQALQGIHPALEVIPFGSHQKGLRLGTREARIGWIPSRASFFGEFWSKDVLSGKLLTQSSEVAAQTLQAWLLSESNLSEMNRLHTEFIPTEAGIEFERNSLQGLRELRWSRLAEITPPTMKDFVARALAQPQLRSTYPIFSLDELVLLWTPGSSGKIASVRRTDSDGYAVQDLKGKKSLGIGDAQWAITELSILVSQSRPSD